GPPWAEASARCAEFILASGWNSLLTGGGLSLLPSKPSAFSTPVDLRPALSSGKGGFYAGQKLLPTLTPRIGYGARRLESAFEEPRLHRAVVTEARQPCDRKARIVPSAVLGAVASFPAERR